MVDESEPRGRARHRDCPLCSKHVWKNKNAEHSAALHFQLSNQNLSWKILWNRSALNHPFN